MLCVRHGVVLSILCGLSGQPRCQLEQIEQMVERAESHLDEERGEEAARLLCSAWRELRTTQAEDVRAKRQLEHKVTVLLRRADPRGVVRMKTLEKAAEDLQELAAEYRERGWLRTAVALLRQVEALDPGRAREELQEARDELAPDPNHLLFDGFERAVALFGEQAWGQGEGWIESPAMEAGQHHLSQALVGWYELLGDAEIRIEVQMTERPGKAGLVLGCPKDGSTFYLVEIVHRATDTAVYVRRYCDGAYDLRYSAAGTLARDVRAGYVPLAVRVEGPDLCVSVADMAPFHARADGPVFGQIGLFVSGDTPNPDPVRFRHLRVSDL